MGQDASSVVGDDVAPLTLTERSLSAVAEHIKSGGAKKIVVLTGAGISTSAGIPDFRSPKTGLYANLARLKLPYAEAVFDISFFRSNPEPFYVLARELYPGRFHPTVSHAFIALLARKGLLEFLFTQNIDCLERAAGVPADRIVEAHGSFATQRCIDCKRAYPDGLMREHVDRGDVPRCRGAAGDEEDGSDSSRGEYGEVRDPDCNGLVKPDIVFFGEALPKAFDREAQVRMFKADMVLVIGTSLTVYPFAALPDMARQQTPRLLFNLERVGKLGTRPDDVLALGDCDSGIRRLADELGWREELEELWRGLVGDKEARRQLGGDAVDDEVARLTEEVGTALNIGDKPGDESTDKPDQSEDRPEDKSGDEDESTGKDESGTKGKLEDKSEDKSEDKPEPTSVPAEPRTDPEVAPVSKEEPVKL